MLSDLSSSVIDKVIFESSLAVTIAPSRFTKLLESLAFLNRRRSTMTRVVGVTSIISVLLTINVPSL